jgi:hypothetical protein
MRARIFVAPVAIAVVGLATTTPAGQADLLGKGTGGSGANFTLDGKPCKLIPVPAAAPAGTGTCPGVRPGAIVNSDVGPDRRRRWRGVLGAGRGPGGHGFKRRPNR